MHSLTVLVSLELPELNLVSPGNDAKTWGPFTLLTRLTSFTLLGQAAPPPLLVALGALPRLAAMQAKLTLIEQLQTC